MTGEPPLFAKREYIVTLATPCGSDAEICTRVMVTRTGLQVEESECIKLVEEKVGAPIVGPEGAGGAPVTTTVTVRVAGVPLQ